MVESRTTGSMLNTPPFAAFLMRSLRLASKVCRRERVERVAGNENVKTIRGARTGTYFFVFRHRLG